MLDRARLVAGKRWSGEDLVGAAERFEESIRDIIPSGEPIAIVAVNSGESVAMLAAVLGSDHAGVLLPVALRAEEIVSALEDGAIRYVALPEGFAPPEALATWSEVGDRAGVRILERKVSGTGSPLAGVPVLGQITSGSTRPSRLAVRPLVGVLTEAEAVADALKLDQNDRVLCCSSIAHSYALIGGLLASLRRSAEVVLAPSPAEAPALAIQSSPTVILGLPTTYRSLLDLHVGDGLVHVRLALCAGAPLEDLVFEAFQRETGVAIRQDYGTTETGTIALDLASEPGPSVAGMPLPHIEIEIGDGEILVRSPAVARWYVEDGALRPCLDSDGWYHTGDLGHVGDDGRLRLDGRLRTPIVVGDHLVHPEVVETAIARHPGVQDVVVVPVPTSEGDTLVKAVLVAPSLTEGDLRRWTAANLCPFEEPSIVEIRERLPYSPAGKLLLKYL